MYTKVVQCTCMYIVELTKFKDYTVYSKTE